jgi:cell division protein FtsW (lipid II flippase)
VLLLAQYSFLLVWYALIYQYTRCHTSWYQHGKLELKISPQETAKNNYQSEQAKIAIATGGIIGKGPGQ